MFADLEWLIKLQLLDYEIYKLTSDQRKGNSNVKKLGEEVEDISLRKLKQNRELKRTIEEKAKLLDDIQEQKRILEQKRIDLQNDKKTKKEHIRREIKKMEQAVEVFSQRVETISSDISHLEQEIHNKEVRISELKTDLQDEDKTIGKVIKKTKKQLTDLEKKRATLEVNIRKPFLNHYNRIMNIRNGVAITYVNEKGLCQGCQVHIPIQSQQKIRLMDDYNICEGCGRILVVKEAMETVTEEA